MTVKLLTEYNLEFLSLQGGCTGSSESTLVKMPHCWKCWGSNFVNIKRKVLEIFEHLPYLSSHAGLCVVISGVNGFRS